MTEVELCNIVKESNLFPGFTLHEEVGMDINGNSCDLVENEALVGCNQIMKGRMENKWVIIGAIGNIALVVLNIINLVRHWN